MTATPQPPDRPGTHVGERVDDLGFEGLVATWVWSGVAWHRADTAAQLHQVSRVEDVQASLRHVGSPRQTPDEPSVSLATVHALLLSAPKAPLGARLAIRPLPGGATGTVHAVLVWETPEGGSDAR